MESVNKIAGAVFEENYEAKGKEKEQSYPKDRSEQRHGPDGILLSLSGQRRRQEQVRV